MDTSATAGTARRALAARTLRRRRPPRGRYWRLLAAAGFAGVAVGLPAAGNPVPPPAADPRFGTSVLVTGQVVVPVRFADAGGAAFLRPGDRIDVLAVDDSAAPFAVPSHSVPDVVGPTATQSDARVASDVSVLEIGGSADGASRSTAPLRATDGDAGLVFLAVDNGTAERLARASARERLSYALRSPRGH